LNVGTWPMGVSEMMDIPWLHKEGGRLLWGFDPHARGVQGQGARSSHDITIYPDDMSWKVSGFYRTSG
jgi:hypothetical protein